MRSVNLFCCLFAFLLAVGLAPQTRAEEEVITNKDVIELIKAGLGQDLIARKVTSTDSAFDMSPKSMIELKQNNVPDQIIELMLQEHMKTQKKLRARIALEIQNLASENPEIAGKAFDYLRAIDSVAIPQLVESLGSNTPEVRAVVVKALGDLNDKDAAPRLRGLLTDKTTAVRLNAAYSLNLLRDEDSLSVARKCISSGVPPLDGYLKLAGLRKDVEYVGFIGVRLLKDTEPQTRAMAAWALGEIGSERGVGPLEDALLNDREVEVKKEAAQALGKIKADGSFEKLADVCRRFPTVRKDMLEAIGQYPVNRSAPFLVAALAQPLTPEQKTTVLNALRRLTGRDYGDDIPAWRNWLADNKITGAPAEAAPSPATAPAAPAAAIAPAAEAPKPAEPAAAPTTGEQPKAPELPEAPK